MRCHYDVLGVDRTCSDEDLKKSYRKLALRWHPDKNPENVDECTRIFHEIGEAYEVLVDPQERAFYDKHREAILRGGDNYVDRSIDLMKYFNPSVYKGFADDVDGFFAVYSNIFDLIDREDDEFRSEDDDFVAPEFGNSTSTYEDVVRSFYAYWQGYRTRKTYVWTDKYDIRQAPNRPTQRAMEKENKKSREAARRERNEEVRSLVAFVKKRDVRVKAYWKELEERQSEAKIAMEKKRMKELQEKYESQRNYEEQEWLSFDNMKDTLNTIEAQIDREFGGGSSGDDSSSEIIPGYYCVACEKTFKTEKALENHERSRKHKDNVEIIKREMEEEFHSSASSMSLDTMDDGCLSSEGVNSSNDDEDTDKQNNDDDDDEPATGNSEWSYKHQDSLLLPQNVIMLDVKKQHRSNTHSDDEISDAIWMKQSIPVRNTNMKREVILNQATGGAFRNHLESDASDDSSWMEYMNTMGLSARDSLNLPRRKGSKKSDLKKRRKKGEMPAYPLTKIDSEGSLSSEPHSLSRIASVEVPDDAQEILNTDVVYDIVKEILNECINRVVISSDEETTERAAIAQNITDDESSDKEEMKVTGKVKSSKRRSDKKRNKASRQGNADDEVTTPKIDPNKCHTCGQKFASRNKLFQHVEKTKHALRLDDVNSGNNATKTKKGKKNKKSMR